MKPLLLLCAICLVTLLGCAKPPKMLKSDKCPTSDCVWAEAIALKDGHVIAYYDHGWEEVWGQPFDPTEHECLSAPPCPEGHTCSFDEVCNLDISGGNYLKKNWVDINPDEVTK